MSQGFLGADLAGPEKEVHIGLVDRELASLPVLDGIGPGVADIGDEEPLPRKEGGDEGRPHPLGLGMGVLVGIDGLVGLPIGLLQPFLVAMGQNMGLLVSEKGGDDVDGHLGGNVAFVGPAHAVGNGKEDFPGRVHRNVGPVLVMAPYLPAVGSVGVCPMDRIADHFASFAWYLALSCPQAASMSVPNSLRTVHLMPRALRMSRKR